MSSKDAGNGQKAPMPDSTSAPKPTGKPVKGNDNPGTPIASKGGTSKGTASKGGGASKPTSHGGKPGAGKGDL